MPRWLARPYKDVEVFKLGLLACSNDQGAVEALFQRGSGEPKEKILTWLVEGLWTGTMRSMSRKRVGSIAVRTRAVPLRRWFPPPPPPPISALGQKIFYLRVR